MSAIYKRRHGPRSAWTNLTNVVVLVILMCQKSSQQRVDVPAEVIGKLKFIIIKH